MREKLAPWTAAIFCACLSFFTIVSNLILGYVSGRSIPGESIVFVCFMPMCFVFIGGYLSGLRNEQIELKIRLDELLASTPKKNHAA